MKQLWLKLRSRWRWKEILLFLLFYYLSTVIYYTATWITYGAFDPGHPPYWNVQEFFAAAGAQFIVSFLVTLPILYLVIYRWQASGQWRALLSHLFFAPLFVALVYLLLTEVKDYFGWKMIWSGNKSIWTLYGLLMFYLLQFGLVHAYVYQQRYTRGLRERALLREAALQSRLTALQAQLNPHFLHNLFNSINASIPPEQETTRELIVRLSDLFRYQHLAADKTRVPLRDELTFIRNYLDVMKVRLKERLIVSIQVDESLLATTLPPMLLHPLVENAVHHGIAPKIGCSELRIEIRQREGKRHFTIADTGRGLPPDWDAHDRGTGLSTTRLRLQKIYGSDLLLRPNHPSGLIVNFSI